MIKIEHLNTCPTCGKKDEIQTGHRGPGRYFIECYRCHVNVYDDRPEKVQAHWNAIRRAEHSLEEVKMLYRKLETAAGVNIRLGEENQHLSSQNQQLNSRILEAGHILAELGDANDNLRELLFQVVYEYEQNDRRWSTILDIKNALKK